MWNGIKRINMACSSNKNVIFFFIFTIFTNFWREIEKIRIVASLCQHIFCALYFSVSISCNFHLDVFRILLFAIQKLLHCEKVASKVLRICVFRYVQVHGENKTFDKNQYKKKTIKTTPYSTYNHTHMESIQNQKVSTLLFHSTFIYIPNIFDSIGMGLGIRITNRPTKIYYTLHINNIVPYSPI